ncbi:MAG: DUF6438 domain-containing protein [Alphaproteobacteria bacterium]
MSRLTPSRPASSRNGRSADLPLALLLAATVATACSPAEKGVAQGRADDPVISLSEGTCVGTCPVYDITLHPNGKYLMNGERYVKTLGVTDGALSAKAWTAAEKVLKEADFWKLDPLQTAANLSNCQPDAPTVKVMWRTSEGKQKTVTYDAGCGVQKMQEMVTDLREAMDFDGLVWTDRKFEYAQPLLK